MDPKQEALFDVETPLGFRVRCTQQYWDFLAELKHPALKGREKEVAMVLREPREVRRSRKDPAVYLFYRGDAPRWLCAVAKDQQGQGFLVTAYPADKIKMGDIVWTR